MSKLFISYNHNDAQLVDTIARKLELEFGRNNIFYDAWSIQHGDSIIGKMNEGLNGFDTFFLFLSPNSLTSKMVGLEWRSALNRAVNNNIKFVVVRIAECNPPAILGDMLYIDLYGEGLDSSVERMKKVAKLENCYTPLDDVQNYSVEFSVIDENTAKFTIRATLYAEHNPQFGFACENKLEDFSVKSPNELLTSTSSGVLFDNDGTNLHMHLVRLHRALKPGFPYVAEIKRNCSDTLRNFSVYVLINDETSQYQRLTVKKV